MPILFEVINCCEIKKMFVLKLNGALLPRDCAPPHCDADADADAAAGCEDAKKQKKQKYLNNHFSNFHDI